MEKKWEDNRMKKINFVETNHREKKITFLKFSKRQIFLWIKIYIKENEIILKLMIMIHSTIYI